MRGLDIRTAARGRPSLRVRAHDRLASRGRLETPHSGYHWDGIRERFFEGWYFKVSIGDAHAVAGSKTGSFAFMYSVEDPGSFSPTAGVGAQVMGPSDSYMVQYSRDTRRFWGWKHRLGLGCAFRTRTSAGATSSEPKEEAFPTTALEASSFDSEVEQGFQVTTSWHQGTLALDSSGTGGVIAPSVTSCSWAYEMEPVHGWGDAAGTQKATAGWLAALPVFEPHWQILMSYGKSTGSITWGGDTYTFEGAPSYAEKNWGEGFPLKWFWIQCNTFGDEDCTAVTAGGGRRTLPFSLQASEDVAMIGVHHAGRFIEIVPWQGEVRWAVAPWGSWEMEGKAGDVTVKLEATADAPGTLLRAPTRDAGLTTVCRDTFEGRLRLRMWERGRLTLDLASQSCALEVGGGPWYEDWKGDAEMKEPLRSALQLPIDVATVTPRVLWPDGL